MESKTNSVPGYLSSSKVKAQKETWGYYYRGDNFLTKPLDNALAFTIGTNLLPLFLALLPIYAVTQGRPLLGYSYSSRGLGKLDCTITLLRCYYGGHESLGTGKTDKIAGKGYRVFTGKWDRKHSGTVRRALGGIKKAESGFRQECEQLSKEYSDYHELSYIVSTREKADDFKNKRYLDLNNPEIISDEAYQHAKARVDEYNEKAKDIHDRTFQCPLKCLKNELLAKGESVNLKGELAAVIYVIQDKCDINVIDLNTINGEIATAKAAKTPSSSNNSRSFWSSINPFATSRSKNDDASHTEDTGLDGAQ